MQIDLELYRHEVSVSKQPSVRLSVIDIAPDFAQRAIVFVHGFGGHAGQWTYQLQQFSDRNRVLAVDLRGHGRSDKPRSGYDMGSIQSDLEMMMDTLGLTDGITLVGHSFGGAVVSEFAAAHPQRIDRLVLIAATGEYKLNPLFRMLLKLPYRTLQMLTPFTRNWLGAPPHILKSWYVDTMAAWRGWDLFAGLQAPTLVVRGHLDAVFEKPVIERVAQSIPGAEEVDVGASGHMVMLERHAATNRAIARFLGTERRSWSRAGTPVEEAGPNRLLSERPWLPNYEQDVPDTIAVPRAPLHQLINSAARRFPAHTAIIFEGKRLSYRRLEWEANRFANLLRSLGVEKGDRVMLIMPNLPQLVIAFFGIIKAGATAVFSLPTNPAEELTRQIRDSGSSVLITLTQFDDLIHQIRTELEPSGASPLKHVIFTHLADYLPLFKRLAFMLSRQRRREHLLDDHLDASTHMFSKVLYSHNKEAPQVEVGPNDLAVIQYTGGTTAAPKGVMLSHGNLMANAFQTRHWIPSALEKKERVLCALPFSHSYGLTAALTVGVALGATLILKARFETEDILRTIQKYRPTIFPGVPQMYVFIKDFPGVRKYGVDSIQACLSGAAPLPVEVQEAFEKLTRGRLVEGYGLTEASPVTHANPLNGRRKVGSIGLPLPSTEARLVDLRKGQEMVAVGQIGELAIRGPQVMQGYWNDPQATREVLSADGWLRTGDVAQMDQDGYFRIIARKVDMWYPTKPGEPAFPRDLEEVLFEIPQVKDAAAVAIAGQPIAFVMTGKDRPTADAIIAYCKRRLPPELAPRLVIFLDEFPRTFIGKVLRRELIRRFQESRGEDS